MHDNANIAFQLQETISIYDTVLGLQPKVGGSGEGERSPEEIVDEFAEQLAEQVGLHPSKPRQRMNTGGGHHSKTRTLRRSSNGSALTAHPSRPPFDPFVVRPPLPAVAGTSC